MKTEAPTVRPSADELLHALGHAVIATDPRGSVLFWNQAAEQLYGWAAEDAVGRDVTDVTVPGLSRRAAAVIRAALRVGRSWSGGFAVQRRSGEMRHALVASSGVYRDGKLIGIVAASLDLGDAVRHLLERSSDVTVIVDKRQVITYASPAAVRLFSWPVDGAAGTLITDLIHPDDRKVLDELLAPDTTQAERGELRIRSDDTWSWVEVVVTDLDTLPGAEGRVYNIRRSERLARLEERQRILEAVHAEVLQDLFAAALELEQVARRSPAPIATAIDAARGALGRATGTLRELVKL